MRTADPVDEWRDTVQGYQMSKTNLQFNQEPVKHVRHGEIKQIETMYNPILQQYTDPGLERDVKQMERSNLVDTLAKNKDRALRYEQTFDVINFDDKLKGLEDKEGYPKPKSQNKNVVGGTKTFTEYNILSNLPFQEHHYLPPEQRPPLPKEKPKKNVKVTTTGLRDYNIITNRYLELHDEKIDVDKEIERLNAAKKYWKTHNFDPLTIAYCDPDKEQQFQETKKEEERTHGQDWVQKLPKSWKEEGGLYNPINGRIEDEKRLYEKDLKDKNKRKRFELRYDMEKQFRKQALGEEERSSKISLNKVNVQRFKDTTNRGFDILTNKHFNNASDSGSKTVYEPNVKPPPSTWTKIKNTSNAFADFKSGSSHGFSRQASGSEPKMLDDVVDGGDLNDRLYDTVHDEFMKTSIERRSKRLMKGSKTMSNFHKTNNNLNNQAAKFANERKGNEARVPVKATADIAPIQTETHVPVPPINRESNQSALRKSMNASSRHSNIGAGKGATAIRTGRDIMSQTPKSKHTSMVSSNRAIRTGAFQRIKA